MYDFSFDDPLAWLAVLIAAAVLCAWELVKWLITR